jgi:hypothetical protein
MDTRHQQPHCTISQQDIAKITGKWLDDPGGRPAISLLALALYHWALVSQNNLSM